MAIFRLKKGDSMTFKLIIILVIMYSLMSILVYFIINMKFIKPLGFDAPLDRFSEARAFHHLRVLSQDIDGRQEGRPGLKKAGDYIKNQLEGLKVRAHSDIRIEVEESMVNGSFNMLFLRHSISLTYRAHNNVLMRISSVNSTASDASVLVNAHYDSPLGSPGAGDCGSCVASMLELARLIVDCGWIPPKPIIFLFNGAEELFMLGSHGFITTHRWRDTIGAFINIEASGNGGPDLVCQSGPGSWPVLVYSHSAVYPMAQSSAQDVFGIIPGDTDYRMFAQDYGDIPGLDIIFLLGGYFYHTSYDTLERLLYALELLPWYMFFLVLVLTFVDLFTASYSLSCYCHFVRPGSMQARGDNLFSLVKAFAASSMLKNATERRIVKSFAEETTHSPAIFFDYLTWFMVLYPRKVASVIHTLPVAIFLLPIILRLTNFGVHLCFATYFDFLKGALLHILAIIMAIIVPVIFSVVRLFFSSHAMNWFARPYLAYMMFIPCSVVGLLIPRFVWRGFHLSQDTSVLKMSSEALSDEARFWGAFGFYALLTLACLLSGLGGGFLTFFVSVSLLVAWFCTWLFCSHGKTLRLVVVYIIPFLPCLLFSVHFSGFLMQFVIEKMGMMGSIPPPFGYYMQDIIVAVMVGVVTGWCVGPLLPVISGWLARSSVMIFLLHLSVLGLAISSAFFPYNVEAPKRIVMQHAIVTAESTQILDSSYEFAVVDANSLSFLFKHSPEAAERVKISSADSSESTSDRWLALFPVSFLFSKSLKFPTSHEDVLKQYNSFPHLTSVDNEVLNVAGSRKIHLELDLGSLKEVWVTVLNITGPLSGWSFADNTLPAPEMIDGGPPSYICRLSGSSHEKWTFWLEANSSEPLRVEVAVLDQHLVAGTKELKDLFPDWVDVITYTSFLSGYTF